MTWWRIGAVAFLAVTIYVITRPSNVGIEGPLSVVGALTWFGLALVAVGWAIGEAERLYRKRVDGRTEHLYDGLVEPRRRGELGYGDWALHLIELGMCSCEGCGGHLVDDVCRSCGCNHHVQEATRFTKRGPAWIPNYVEARCADADRDRAEQQREYERQARRRWQAEELGDPQR